MKNLGTTGSGDICIGLVSTQCYLHGDHDIDTEQAVPAILSQDTLAGQCTALNPTLPLIWRIPHINLIAASTHKRVIAEISNFNRYKKSNSKSQPKSYQNPTPRPQTKISNPKFLEKERDFKDSFSVISVYLPLCTARSSSPTVSRHPPKWMGVP